MRPVIRIDGQPATPAEHASIVEVENGVYSILADGASYEVRAGEGEFSVAGHRHTFEIEDPRTWQRSSGATGAHGRASITAPMPGKIVRVLVQVDTEVEAGQPVIVVEAMKMQNELKAPRAGRVERIAVAEGDSVNAGMVLAVIG